SAARDLIKTKASRTFAPARRRHARYHAAPAKPQHRRVEIVHATGLEGARDARGVVVVIDVLRSFTVSAYALAGGARECLLVSTVAEAGRLARDIPDALL